MGFHRTHLLVTTAALAFIATNAQAQTAPAAPAPAPATAQTDPAPIDPVPTDPASTDTAAPDQAAEGETVVTGTRLRGGFTAPTPMKVLGGQQLAERALSNIGDFLNEIPSFRPTQTPQSNTNSARNSGQNFADLRALGSIRTLTLVNSRRFVPSSSTGQVDLNLIPTSLVSRIDVVTGGASAAYGSDAVAGVVNIVIDDTLQGFKGDVSYGVSQHGDAAEKRLSLAFGTAFDGGRGHLSLGGEYVASGSIDNVFERDWGRKQSELVSYIGTRPAGAPSRFYATGVQALNYAYGGVILGNNADTNAANGVDVLRGIQFGPGGAVQAFPYGTAIGTSSINFTGGNSRLYARTGHQLVIPVTRRVAMATFDYELTDGLTLFAEGNYGRSQARLHSPPVRDMTATGAVIRRDNAFLPAQIASIMDANGITSFGLGRQYDDFGPVNVTSENKTERLLAGVRGKFGDGWTYDAYYQYGHNSYDLSSTSLRIEQNFRYALDSIVVGGQPVCRDATARANGCVAINVFGAGSPSRAAINYVTGTAFYHVVTTQELVAGNLQGEPFSTWAGPVGIAVGAERRKERADAIADPIGNAGGFNYGNARAFNGAYTVKEAYGEATVPLARDLPLLKLLDLNGAVRFTDYSNTGGVTTWKVGAIWEPVGGIRVRASRSRDIRAPNNNEFGAVTTTNATLTNPFSGATLQPAIISAPSPTLRPEKADTTTIGVVFSPSAVPGLNISVDYYDIKINDAISTLGFQVIADGCFAEVNRGAPGFYCNFVNRTGTGTATVINSVTTQLLNIAQLKTSGFDFEASYRFPFLGGRMTTRLLGNYTAHLISDDGQGIARTYNGAGVLTSVGSVVDRAGQLGGFTSGVNVGATVIPRWSLNGSATYAAGPFTTTLSGRFFSNGTFDNTLVGPGDRDYDPASPISIASNRIKGAFYLNLSASYDIIDSGKHKVQVYGLVNNVLNRDPSFPEMSLLGLYDRIGRFFKLGVRVTY